MKSKKLMSLGLSLAMAMSLAVPAFAADTTIADAAGLGTGASTEVTGETKVPTIKVTVPGTAAAIVNPYKLEFQAAATGGGDDGTGPLMANDQIFTATNYIKSESDVPLKVSVTATGKVEGEAVLSTASVVNNTKLLTKSAFVYFQIKGATAAKNATADTIDITDPTWGTFDAKDTGTIVLSTKAVAKANVLTLAAATEVDNTAGDDKVTVPAVAAFRLSGDAVAAPTKGWTATDKISATLAFTFVADGNSTTP